MYSCSQVRQHGAMSKRGQKTNSNEGSPMANARPCLVARDPRSEEISSPNLESLVNPENTDERKEVVIAAGSSMRSATRSEIGYSQANKSYTNHQYMSKIFQFLQKRLGMSASDATFSMQAYKTNVLIWRLFTSSSMKADIHLGSNYLTNSEIYKNTKFEEIESLFNITQKLVMEHSEGILNVKCLEYSPPSWARPV